MPHLTPGRSPSQVTLGMSAILFSLAGCSGGGSGPSAALPSAAQAQPAGRSSHALTRLDVRRSSLLVPVKSLVVKPDLSAGFADADAKSTASILISDAGTNDVYAYTTAGKLVATVTGFDEPQGMFATKAGNFYVANTQSSDVLLYSGNFNQVATLNDPAGLPWTLGTTKRPEPLASPTSNRHRAEPVAFRSTPKAAQRLARPSLIRSGRAPTLAPSTETVVSSSTGSTRTESSFSA